jgi:hypothetical protein
LDGNGINSLRVEQKNGGKSLIDADIAAKVLSTWLTPIKPKYLLLKKSWSIGGPNAEKIPGDAEFRGIPGLADWASGNTDAASDVSWTRPAS